MAMTYLSTRGENDGATYASIVLKGLAADGGLDSFSAGIWD